MINNNSRVFNVTRRFSLKHKQALRAVEQCACAWVEYGVSIRDLTVAESIAARNRQAQLREPLAVAELPGLVFAPPVTAVIGAIERNRLTWAAVQFARENG
jgi:hypothetical protein